jgi:hypothetical protein
MGILYDPVINDLSISVGRYLKSTLNLPKVARVPTKPGAIIRGLLGHLLAAKVSEEHFDSDFDSKLRPLIFDSALPIPEDIHIYYWVFPYDISVVMRDFGVTSLDYPSKGPTFCNSIRYFPLAYLMTNAAAYGELEELTTHRNSEIQSVASIPIRLTETKPAFWPAGAESNVVIGGESLWNSAVALPRHRGRQA